MKVKGLLIFWLVPIASTCGAKQVLVSLVWIFIAVCFGCSRVHWWGQRYSHDERTGAHSYLVGGLEHVLFFIIFLYIGNFTIPTDEFMFFRGVGIPPTTYCYHIPAQIKQNSAPPSRLYPHIFWLITCVVANITIFPLARFEKGNGGHPSYSVSNKHLVPQWYTRMEHPQLPNWVFRGL